MEKRTLPNGMTIVVERIEYLRTVSIGVWVRNGSIHENSQTTGLNHLIEHMIFKGTKNRNSIEIAKEMDFLGGNINAFSSREYSCYYAKVISEHLPHAINLLGDLISNPTFPENELINEKKVVLEEINMYDDSPDDLVFEIFSQKYWGKDHPYGRPVLGTREKVSSYQRDDIIEYHQKKYIAPNIVISIAGNAPSMEEIIELIEENFSLPQIGDKNSLIVEIPPSNQENIFLKKDIQQANVVLGTKGVNYQQERLRYAQTIFNIALGGGSSSRLFQSLREQHGLVYTVYSFQTPYFSDGVFGMFFATSSDKVEQALKLLNEEIDEIINDGLTEEEIKLAKNQIIFSLLMGLESTSNVMHKNGKRAIYDCYHDKTIDEVIESIKSITLQETNKLSQTILSSHNFMISMVGKYDGKKLDFSFFNNHQLKEIDKWQS